MYVLQGADTIVQLIKKAEFLTPVEKRQSAPLIVRATAGLRLLPADKANQLIHQVDTAVSRLVEYTKLDDVRAIK